jgi:hypothetical protein
VSPPYQAQVKAFITYPLPLWNLRTSATFQSLPGPEITAQYVAPNAVIAPSLGRNLAAGSGGTATIDLIPFGTLYGERLYQTDFRLAKTIRIGRTHVDAAMDVYNLLNASTVLSYNTRYGPSWLAPTQILPGRMFKFGGQLNF